MPTFKGAGADAAHDYDAAFRKIIDNDPDVQAVIQRVWGTGPRPSDTPKHLEKANHQASKEIEQILKAKGIDLPDRTFINPRSGTIEGHRGWSGLNGWQKAAIIAAGAATGVGAGMALAGGGAAAAGAGAGGGAAASGAGGGLAAGTIPSLAVTSGLPAGVTIGSTVPVGAGLAGASGSTLGTMLTNAGINAATTKARGGSWKDALLAGGTGAVTGGLAGGTGNMGWTDILKSYGKDLATSAGGNLMQRLLSGESLATAGEGLGAIGQTQAHNRGVALDAMMAGDQNRIAAEQDRRAAESDIMKKMQIANYIKSGGFQDTGSGVSANGKPFTRFDFGTRPTSESEIQMATELEGQLKDRLRNPLKLSDYASKMEPGKMETTTNWLSPILSVLGAARGAGKYNMPYIKGEQPSGAPTQTPTPAPVFTPAAVNPAGENPWSKVRF